MPNSNWCQGDFNQNGSVDGADFGIWNTNKFLSSDAARNSGPNAEPSTAGHMVRRVKPAAMGIDAGVVRAPVTPVVQFAAATPAAAPQFQHAEVVFASQAATAKLDTSWQRPAKSVSAAIRIQSRVSKADAHDEVMNLFETF